jgi:hypothetical protein
MKENLMNTYTFLSDMIEDNGKSVKENNMEKNHNIPIGSLVEIKETGERLYVCMQTRDCDGTPLYALCLWEVLADFFHIDFKNCKPADLENDKSLVNKQELLNFLSDIKNRMTKNLQFGYSEDCLEFIR